MIESKDIEKLAQLSRIKLSEQEKNSFFKEIDSILDYLSQIREAGGGEKGVADTVVTKNVLREDENAHEEGVFTESILKASPDREGNFVKVKKII